MPTRSRNRNLSYGLGQPIITGAPSPIIAQRAPTANDFAPIATVWVDQPNDDNYILTRVVANAATWINAGGGGGVFDTVTTVNGIVCGTTLAVGTSATVGTTLEVTGNTTLNTGIGVVLSSAAGLITAADGTDGQLLIASTGAGAPAWAAITSATLVITPGAGTLNIEESGGTANSYVTDVGGPVAPLVGVMDMLGGTNITTDGSVANTITFDLDDDVTLAGFMTAGDSITMASGVCTIEATDDVAQVIYLHTDGGTNETIELYCDQGTDVASINVHSDLGGVHIESGLSTADAINLFCSDAAGGIDIDSGTGGIILDSAGVISIDANDASNFTVTGAFDLDVGTTLGSLNLTAGEAAANAIVIDASDAGGGIDVDCGTGGMSFVAANGIIAFESGTAAINVGTDAAAHTVTIGNVTGATAVAINSGTGGIALASTGVGDITIDSDDTLLLDADGVLELNSSAGIIGIGNDADAFDINIGTGAAARTVTIGNATGATAVAIDCGSGDITATATLGSITLESTEDAADAIYLHTNGGITETIHLLSTQGTAAAAIHLQALAGGVNLTSAVASAASLTLVASDAAGGIDIDYGTGGMTIDATNGALTIQTGTGAISIGADAVAKTVTVGTTTGAGDTIIQSGTGNTSITSTGAILADCAGVLEINSTGGIIGIGSDADAFDINVGTGAAARTITIGNATGATAIALNAGTGAVDIGTNAIAHTTTVGTVTGAGSTVLQSGTGDTLITSTDAITLDCAGVLELNSTAGAISIGNDADAQAVNVGTGAAARTVTVGSVNTTAATTIQSGTGDLALTSTDAITLDCAGLLELNSTSAAINIGNDADAQAVNIGTGAAVRPVTVGSTTGASDTVIQSGTGGISIEAAGIVDMVPVTDSQAAAACTANANVGVCTFTGQTPGAGAQLTLTVTNSVCTVGSAILCSVSNLGANDCRLTIERVTPGAGSFTVQTQNNGAAACNGDIILTFWIIAA